MKPICGGKPREPRRRHLLGNGDGGERQAGDRVGAEVAPAPAANDRNNGQGLSGAAAGGAFIASSALLARLILIGGAFRTIRRPAVNEGE